MIEPGPPKYELPLLPDDEGDQLTDSFDTVPHLNHAQIDDRRFAVTPDEQRAIQPIIEKLIQNIPDGIPLRPPELSALIQLDIVKALPLITSAVRTVNLRTAPVIFTELFRAWNISDSDHAAHYVLAEFARMVANRFHKILFLQDLTAWQYFLTTFSQFTTESQFSFLKEVFRPILEMNLSPNTDLTGKTEHQAALTHQSVFPIAAQSLETYGRPESHPENQDRFRVSEYWTEVKDKNGKLVGYRLYTLVALSDGPTGSTNGAQDAESAVVASTETCITDVKQLPTIVRYVEQCLPLLPSGRKFRAATLVVSLFTTDIDLLGNVKKVEHGGISVGDSPLYSVDSFGTVTTYSTGEIRDTWYPNMPALLGRMDFSDTQLAQATAPTTEMFAGDHIGMGTDGIQIDLYELRNTVRSSTSSELEKVNDLCQLGQEDRVARTEHLPNGSYADDATFILASRPKTIDLDGMKGLQQIHPAANAA